MSIIELNNNTNKYRKISATKQTMLTKATFLFATALIATCLLTNQAFAATSQQSTATTSTTTKKPASIQSAKLTQQQPTSNATTSITASANSKPVVLPAGLIVAPLLNQTPIIAPVKVNFTDCGPKNIKDVRITPCPGDGSVCNINLGTNVTVEADFIAKHEASSLSELIQGVIRGRELQFPEQRADPCKSTISPSCPIKISKHYQYKAIFEIKPYYPAIPVKVRYALLNQNGDVVACVQIAAKIVDPSPVRSSRNKAKNAASNNKKP